MQLTYSFDEEMGAGSGLLNPSGHPGRLLGAVLSGHHILALDGRMHAEYSAVLKTPKFKFDKADVRDLLSFLQKQHWINAVGPKKISLTN